DWGLTALSVTVPAVAVAVGIVKAKPEAAIGISTTCPPPLPEGGEEGPPDEPPPQPEAISTIGIASTAAILAALMCRVFPSLARRPPVVGARYTIRRFVNIRCARRLLRTRLVASDPMFAACGQVRAAGRTRLTRVSAALLLLTTLLLTVSLTQAAASPTIASKRAEAKQAPLQIQAMQ